MQTKRQNEHYYLIWPDTVRFSVKSLLVQKNLKQKIDLVREEHCKRPNQFVLMRGNSDTIKQVK